MASITGGGEGLRPIAGTDVVSDLLDRTTAAALEEKKKLQKHFGRFDILFFLICTLVGLDTIGSVARNGGQDFSWLIFLALFFFVPYALLTAELGAAPPGPRPGAPSRSAGAGAAGGPGSRPGGGRARARAPDLR